MNTISTPFGRIFYMKGLVSISIFNFCISFASPDGFDKDYKRGKNEYNLGLFWVKWGILKRKG